MKSTPFLDKLIKPAILILGFLLLVACSESNGSNNNALGNFALVDACVENGVYAIYPVYGASDADVYLGQSDKIIVCRNTARLNVADILAFDLPGLTPRLRGVGWSQLRRRPSNRLISPALRHAIWACGKTSNRLQIQCLKVDEEAFRV